MRPKPIALSTDSEALARAQRAFGHRLDAARAYQMGVPSVGDARVGAAHVSETGIGQAVLIEVFDRARATELLWAETPDELMAAAALMTERRQRSLQQARIQRHEEEE